MGLRLGHGNVDQWRYIIHHRSKWDAGTDANGNPTGDNYSECHPMPNPDFSKVWFNSNWMDGGVETDGTHVSSFCVLIPDAWRSEYNSGIPP